jgi:spoIIIJ-associated protein
MKKNSRRHVPQPRRIELDYSEKWGKDVEEATKLALADLKISEQEAEVTVLEQPTKGFLGIGAKLAKVRVEKKENAEDEPAAGNGSPEQSPSGPAESAAGAESLDIGKVRDLRKNKGDAAAGAGGAGRSSGGSSRGPRSGRSEGRGGAPRARERGGERSGRYGRTEENRSEDRNESRNGERSAERNGEKSESRAYWLASGNTGRRGRDGRANRLNFAGASERSERGSRSDQGAQSEFASEAVGGKGFLINERPDDLRPVSEGNAAEAFFRDVVGKMGLNVDIRVLENDECVYIEVEGADSRTIIGKRGQTLDSIQYLTNLVTNKAQDKYIRVIVDVEGYRSRREKTLEQLAVKLAKKVERTGRNLRLEPMNPYERKVIHATLQSNGRISTRSEGEEPFRRVIIEKK